MPPFALENAVAALAAAGIALSLALGSPAPLYAVLALGAPPLLLQILRRLRQFELGADVLAALAIVASTVMGQYLVGAILVLMLSGGGALERLAVRRASSVLEALSRRMPHRAHRKRGGELDDVDAAEVAPGDLLVVLPHELCPVDGMVVEGNGTMDESYLTGEPFEIGKTPGSSVLSGAVNGESALAIKAVRPASDSRYARIMRVMEKAEKDRPQLRRLGDKLAAWYVPLTLAVTAATWLLTSDLHRCLAVLVVATPCPLLIAIPIAVIGAISLAARRGIIVKTPAALEEITRCRTVILDKTGTLTFGKAALTSVVTGPGFTELETLALAAGLERYSRHPLAAPIVERARAAGAVLPVISEVSETPGGGLRGLAAGRRLQVVGRKHVPGGLAGLPPLAEGLECLLLVDGALAAVFRFRDGPRPESKPFLTHLSPVHGVAKIMLVSGDRESEVRYLAQAVGITDVHAGKSPEEKVAIVTAETLLSSTLFVGDGINDAPALAAATVGVAVGQNSDITSEAADAVIMTPSIAKLDELIHIGGRMREVALQSAVGGMVLSLLGMALAAAGYLTPVEGAVAQELIDLAAILNALRASILPKNLTDF